MHSRRRFYFPNQSVTDICDKSSTVSSALAGMLQSFYWIFHSIICSALILLAGHQEEHPARKKTKWWGAGVVICLEWGANDLHMMPLSPIISCFIKIENRFYLSGADSLSLFWVWCYISDWELQYICTYAISKWVYSVKVCLQLGCVVASRPTDSLLHFARVVDDAKCIVVTRLCVCPCVCLSIAVCPHYCTDPDVTWGRGRGCPLVVHYWVDLQSVHGLRCYGNIT